MEVQQNYQNSVESAPLQNKLTQYAKNLQRGTITGNDLKEKVESGALSKQERRKITRLAKKLASTPDEAELTERQKLRRLAKEKKMLPKPDKEQRRRKYLQDLEYKREQESAKFTICLGCRKRGHYLKDCPNKSIETERKGTHMCYYCGSRDHSLKDCSGYNGDQTNLPFASCFICNETGHLSRNCPSNSHGLYPKGGCCHVCGEISHLAKNCPQREEE